MLLVLVNMIECVEIDDGFGQVVLVDVLIWWLVLDM